MKTRKAKKLEPLREDQTSDFFGRVIRARYLTALRTGGRQRIEEELGLAA